MTGTNEEVWHLPPRAVLLAAILLLLAAEVGGASMGRYKLELARWARAEMQARPAVHGLVGSLSVEVDRVAPLVLALRSAGGLRHEAP